MNKTQITELTPNGVRSLQQPKVENQFIVVQIVKFEKKKEKNFIYVSDGQFQIKAIANDQTIVSPEKDVNSIIIIKSHIFIKTVGIASYDLALRYKERIGQPVNINQISEESAETRAQAFLINPALIIEQQSVGLKQIVSTAKKTIETTTSKKQRSQQKQAQPLKGDLKDYETIRTLYIGMDRWTIVCRIVKIEYSQFISKKTGKQTKVLNLQLMDRAGVKISGAFFGDVATQYKDILVKDRVYKISKGQLREQSYNNTKNDGLSKFKLVFNSHSSFLEVSDTNSIGNNEDNVITLGQCVNKRILGQEFDVVAILVKIEDTIEVKKEQGPLKKTNLLIADPISNITLHAVVWKQENIPSADLVGKAIIFSRYKLSEFKGSLNLGSVFKSSIQPAEQHGFRKLEAKAMSEYPTYDKLYQITISESNGRSDTCRTIKELQSRLEQLGYDQWAKSDLDIYINRFALKKWHYDGCPHCNKSAQRLSNCNHCGKYVEKTVPHFILGLQICDSTGSLWTTAYDQWAKKIFKVDDQCPIIQEFLKLDAEGLKQRVEQYHYQEYRMRINSKKDNQGRIRHNAGKIYENGMVDEVQRNIEMISKLMIA